MLATAAVPVSSLPYARALRIFYPSCGGVYKKRPWTSRPSDVQFGVANEVRRAFSLDSSTSAAAANWLGEAVRVTTAYSCSHLHWSAHARTSPLIVIFLRRPENPRHELS